MTAHTLYKCPDSCEGCHICNGGLASCTVCKGGEGSLPTECPGYAMNDWTQDAVYSGAIDFKAGAWRYGKQPEAMPLCPTCGCKP